MVNYIFPAGKYSFFLSAGAEFDSNFKNKFKPLSEVLSGSNVDSYESEAVIV